MVECAPCAMPAQEELLRRAIENVVRNAITYTAPQSEVEISLRSAVMQGGAFAEICVRDHGPGATEEELANIFRPFYRVSDARERLPGGKGIPPGSLEQAQGLVPAGQARTDQRWPAPNPDASKARPRGTPGSPSWRC